MAGDGAITVPRRPRRTTSAPVLLFLLCASLAVFYHFGGGRGMLLRLRYADPIQSSDAPVALSGDADKAQLAVNLIKEYRPAASSLSIATRLDIVTGWLRQGGIQIRTREWRSEPLSATGAYYKVLYTLNGPTYSETWAWKVNVGTRVVSAANAPAQRLDGLESDLERMLSSPAPRSAAAPHPPPASGHASHPRHAGDLPPLELLGVLEGNAREALVRSSGRTVAVSLGGHLPDGWILAEVHHRPYGHSFIVVRKAGSERTITIPQTVGASAPAPPPGTGPAVLPSLDPARPRIPQLPAPGPAGPQSPSAGPQPPPPPPPGSPAPSGAPPPGPPDPSGTPQPVPPPPP